jgi:hypothetical protein
MKMIPVFDYNELPKDIVDKLIEYYEETDHRDILNNSFTRYPYLFDWDSNDVLNEIDQWFITQGISLKVGHVIINWEW